MNHIKKWKTFNEAIVDVVSNELSNIFSEDGKLKQEVRNNIKKGLQIISKQFPELKIIDNYIVGAAVTYQYEDESDIDITVVLDPSTSQELMNKADKWIESNLDKGKYAMQYDERPYQFKLSFKTRDDSKSADAVYDSEKNEWIKKPEKEKSIEMWQNKILNDESKEQEIYSDMEKMVQPSLKILYKALIGNATSNQLAPLVKTAFSKYGDTSKIDPDFKLDKKKQAFIKNIRNTAYSRDIEPGYVSQNWGVGNVVYKMFDREEYTNVYEILKDIIKNKKYNDKGILNQLKFALEKVVQDEIGYTPKNKTRIKNFKDLSVFKNAA
jgi:hypothetical protein